MLCYMQKWVIHWYFKFWVFTLWNLSPEIKCRVALTQVCFEPDFFAFRSVLLLQQTSLLQTVSELDRYINIEWIYKECKAWFNSWKWSNLTWNFSNSLTIYFNILPLCGLQLPLREKHYFSFWHWENERKLSTMCVLSIFNFLLGTKVTLFAILVHCRFYQIAQTPWWPVFPPVMESRELVTVSRLGLGLETHFCESRSQRFQVSRLWILQKMVY